MEWCPGSLPTFKSDQLCTTYDAKKSVQWQLQQADLQGQFSYLSIWGEESHRVVKSRNLRVTHCCPALTYGLTGIIHLSNCGEILHV